MRLALAFSFLYFFIVAIEVNATDTTITTTTTNTSTSNNTTTMDYKNQPVQRPHAPTVSVTNSDVCVSGVSGGAQGNAVGIAFGTTVRDPICELIKLSRALRDANMRVASVSILCQDPRVFRSMYMSDTPCPALGKIGQDAKDFWNTYPELRPDYDLYLNDKQILIDAGYMDKDGNMIEKNEVSTTEFKSSTDNWN